MSEVDYALEFPDGEINLPLLESYLQGAHEELRLDNFSIETIRHQRAGDLDADEMEYEDVPVVYTVAELKKLYKELFGVDFKPKKYEWNTRTGQKEEIID